VTRAVIVAILVASTLPASAPAGVLGGAARAPGRMAGRVFGPGGVAGMNRTAAAGRASQAPPVHRRRALSLARSHHGPVARAPTLVGSRGGRRPAVVTGAGARPGVFGRSGDAAMGFVRRNKGPLAAAAALAAFVTDPGPFLGAAGRLAAGAAAGLPPPIGAVATRWRGWAGPALIALILAGALRHRLIPGTGRVRRHP
jgi:hypothetical protein